MHRNYVENFLLLIDLYLFYHSGAEVAVYTAQNFPEFLKTIPAFKEGRLSQALEDAFLAFDEDLIKSESLTKLKELAGCDKDEQTEEER